MTQWNVTAFASPFTGATLGHRKVPKTMGLWDPGPKMAMKMADDMGFDPDHLLYGPVLGWDDPPNS